VDEVWTRRIRRRVSGKKSEREREREREKKD
jgi:hypothetical protein